MGRSAIDALAARLHEDPKGCSELAARLERTYSERARRAKELLPKLLGETPADGGWRAVLEKMKAELGPRVVPAGWIPPSQ